MRGIEIVFAVFIALLCSAAAQQCPNSKNPIPIPNNCNAFYNCSSGSAVLSSCPAGQYYDCMNLKCNTQTYPACCSTDMSVNWTAMFPNMFQMIQYPCTSGVTLQNTLKGACGVYYQCSNSVIVNANCSSGNAFNNITASCQPSIDCSNPFAAASPPASFCPNITASANFTNCNGYVTYNNSQQISNQCPNNLFFSGFSKCCVNQTNAFTMTCLGDPKGPYISNISCSTPGQRVADSYFCNEYYQCVTVAGKNTIMPYFCPLTQMYDWNQNKCVSAMNATTIPGCQPTSYYKCMQSPRRMLKYRCSFFYKWFWNSTTRYNNCISRGCQLSLSLKLN